MTLESFIFRPQAEQPPLKLRRGDNPENPASSAEIPDGSAASALAEASAGAGHGGEYGGSRTQIRSADSSAAGFAHT